MQSSDLTKIRQARVVFADYAIRNQEVQNGANVPRVRSGASPHFSYNGNTFGGFKDTVVLGQRNTTAEELEAILANNFPPPPPPPPPAIAVFWSYWIVFELGANFLVCVYDSTSGAWSTPFDTGLTTSEYRCDNQYDVADAIVLDFRKQDSSSASIFILTLTGTLLEQKDYLPEGVEGGVFPQKDNSSHIFQLTYWDPDAELVHFYMFSGIEQASQEATVAVPAANLLEVGGIDRSARSTALYSWRDTSEFEHVYAYPWGGTLTEIAITDDYSDRSSSYSDLIVFIPKIEGYYNTIWKLSANGAVESYSFPTQNKYDNDANIRVYGINEQHFFCHMEYAAQPNSSDVFIFNKSTLNPEILSDVRNLNWNYYSSASFDFPTGATNRLMVFDITRTQQYGIGAGGNTDSSGKNLFNSEYIGGNTFQLDIYNNQNNMIGAHNTDLLYYYGGYNQATNTNGDTYGYVLTRPTMAPHAMMAFIKYTNDDGDNDGQLDFYQSLDPDYFTVDMDTSMPIDDSIVTVGSKTARYFYIENKAVPGEDDQPTVGYLWMIITDSAWGTSVIDDWIVDWTNFTPTSKEFTGSFYGNGYVVIKLCLSACDASGNGVSIPTNQIDTFVSAYLTALELIPTGSDNTFGNIDTLTFRTWHEANAQAIYTTHISDAFVYSYDDSAADFYPEDTEFVNADVYVLEAESSLSAPISYTSPAMVNGYLSCVNKAGTFMYSKDDDGYHMDFYEASTLAYTRTTFGGPYEFYWNNYDQDPVWMDTEFAVLLRKYPPEDPDSLVTAFNAVNTQTIEQTINVYYDSLDWGAPSSNSFIFNDNDTPAVYAYTGDVLYTPSPVYGNYNFFNGALDNNKGQVGILTYDGNGQHSAVITDGAGDVNTFTFSALNSSTDFNNGGKVNNFFFVTGGDSSSTAVIFDADTNAQVAWTDSNPGSYIERYDNTPSNINFLVYDGSAWYTALFDCATKTFTSNATGATMGYDIYGTSYYYG